MTALLNLFYLYDPWFFHVIRMAFVAGGLASVYLAYKLYKKQLPQGVIIPWDSLIAVIGLIVVSGIPLLLHGSRDFSVIQMYIKLLVLFLLGVVVYNVFYNYEQGKWQLVRDLKLGIIIQAVVGFLALCGVAFMIDFDLSTNVILPRFYGSEQEYRLYNLTSSAFFQLSAFYLMLMHFLLAYNGKNGGIPSYYIFLILFIGVISGRTFFMFSALSILIYFKWRYVPALVMFAAIVFFLARYYPDHPYVAHALEIVINIINGNDSLSSSTDTLMKKHLFMPTLEQFIWGEGYYFTPDHHYYGGTDSGFLRQILYGGAVYSFICFVFTAHFVRRIAVNWFAGSWKFTLSTLAILTILNIKSDTYAFPGIMSVLIMFLSLFGTRGKNLILFKR
ncbi:hypothetical protein RYD26_10570 [Pasteurellaceae bacterium LIM206]|nr:hypothetical protein [Pasteurellaceae bacterium LIM206]